MNPRGVRRRTFLLVPALGLAGCASATAGTSTPSPSATSTTGSPATGSPPTGDPTGPGATGTALDDDALVLRAQQLVADVSALVAAAVHRRPRLGSGFSGLLDLHAAQAGLFSSLAPVTAASATLPRGVSAAHALVVARERATAEALFGLAGQAEDGELAARLVSMSAGLWQRLVAGRLTTAPPTATTASPAADALRGVPVDALQGVLAQEHRAVFLYGSFGARVKVARQAAYEQALEVHRTRRDALESAIRGSGATPVASAAAYPVTGTAAQVEPTMAAVYADLITRMPAGPRDLGSRALLDSALRGLGFGAAPATFPGIPA